MIIKGELRNEKEWVVVTLFEIAGPGCDKRDYSFYGDLVGSWRVQCSDRGHG
jgi:hypothetical protein